MKYHFIRAIILTPFESSLAPLDWEILDAQDYPIHVLYCKTTGAILFHSSNQKSDCAKEISKIYNLLEKLNISVEESKQIIVLRDDENEYDVRDVIKHFNH